MFEFHGKDIKLFISQPMRGRDENTILMERELAKQIVKEKLGVNNVEDINYFNFSADSPFIYLAKSIEVMGDADVVCFYSGWENYRGCLVEWTVAKEYGKKIVYINN